MRHELRNKIESLFPVATWSSFELYVNTGKLAGFLDSTGDDIPDTNHIVKSVLDDFNRVKPEKPIDWCNYLNTRYSAKLDCSEYEISQNKENCLDKFRRWFGLK